jgi:hypothetical protein
MTAWRRGDWARWRWLMAQRWPNLLDGKRLVASIFLRKTRSSVLFEKKNQKTFISRAGSTRIGSFCPNMPPASLGRDDQEKRARLPPGNRRASSGFRLKSH